MRRQICDNTHNVDGELYAHYSLLGQGHATVKYLARRRQIQHYAPGSQQANNMKLAYAVIIVCALLASASAVNAEDESWVIGRWELVYDPHGGEKDALEFLPNGEAFSIWPDGTRIPGIYIVTAEGVKAVFTHQGKDLIATFHADKARELLMIVTSSSGQESIYKKLEQ